jgi:hypothetical protein
MLVTSCHSAEYEPLARPSAFEGAFSEAPRKCDKQIHRKILEERQQRKSLCRVQFGFESFQVADGQAASIHFEHPFRLEAGKITGDEFAHGANL